MKIARYENNSAVVYGKKAQLALFKNFLRNKGITNIQETKDGKTLLVILDEFPAFFGKLPYNIEFSILSNRRGQFFIPTGEGCWSSK